LEAATFDHLGTSGFSSGLVRLKLFRPRFLVYLDVMVVGNSSDQDMGLIDCPGSGMGAAAVFEQGGAIDQLSNSRPVGQINLLSRDAK